MSIRIGFHTQAHGDTLNAGTRRHTCRHPALHTQCRHPATHSGNSRLCSGCHSTPPAKRAKPSPPEQPPTDAQRKAIMLELLAEKAELLKPMSGRGLHLSGWFGRSVAMMCQVHPRMRPMPSTWKSRRHEAHMSLQAGRSPEGPGEFSVLGMRSCWGPLEDWGGFRRFRGGLGVRFWRVKHGLPCRVRHEAHP